ncbi:hypothetical protein DSO57_1006364 [Entomophthora muscae]|uniref:Uncharacterized protein n=1 Tax=Entomophthora muscae TaxID=34485 RepID=A0ACC2SWN7_9FUNG|nr:hypothetical protein DSO57_1006364 [Entomophthora muscae]
MERDLNHMKELVKFYYPSYNPVKTPEAKSEISQKPQKTSFLKIVPYHCCGKTYLKHNKALAHFFEVHFTSLLHLWKETKNTCTKFSDIGNRNIPVVHRAAFFLGSLTHLPDNPTHFRPAPHSKAPLDFTNPYSSALAMAYDYIAVVKAQPIQFLEFIALLKLHASFNNLQTPQSCYWPYWAHFIYPSLSPGVPTIILVKNPPQK